MLKSNFLYLLMLIFLVTSACQPKESATITTYPSISGIYPHLAYYNNEGECGTGAVVPWADKLWVITYGPHLPLGSSDKLYEIDQDLNMQIRPESIGGTPANRMIHKESEQLFIGPYAIGKNGEVRTIPYTDMPGRHTGNARHLTDPANKIYYASMEEGFYEVDVHDLSVKQFYEDGNIRSKKKDDTDTNPAGSLLKGAHGKGYYSGQGVTVYSNNGESGSKALEQFDIEAGSLSEWDGEEWKLVRRNQFVEVTGPGGIYGNTNPETDPIWATGWDHKSVILASRDAEKGWSFYRLPKASHSYDGAHGWNTEWPRIRNVGKEGEPDYLMTMHGMFWKFPESFKEGRTAGIRPRSAYLKVVGDFTRWNDGLVFGTDDSANKEFLNKRSAKGNIQGPGQSNSNLWFGSIDLPDELGPNTANGALWLKEEVTAKVASEPMLFAGWKNKNLWIKNEGKSNVIFTIEIDAKGDGNWETTDEVEVKAGESTRKYFDQNASGEWIRLTANQNTIATAHMAFANPETRKAMQTGIFEGVNTIEQNDFKGGFLYGLGDDRRKLGLVAKSYKEGKPTDLGYYEMDDKFQLVKVEDPTTQQFINDNFQIPKNVFEVDEASVLVIDDKGRRWRLPKGNERYTEPSLAGNLRICREVATERDLFNCHGTFYELPAENADGYAKIRPVASHQLKINDYASYRGMLLLTGVDPEAAASNEHIVVSDDSEVAVWTGAIDDLWQLGKPVGKGGPWANSAIKAGTPSDPYLFAFYDDRSLELTHDSDEDVTFTIQMEPIGHGPWMDWKEVTVPAGKKHVEQFPDGIEARWVRLVGNQNCKATAQFTYK
ncbi:hypothetical protein [Cyclobacterium amurskyense]|uniref:Uncharacterized protein n=1 Tax=Cyclobacterium amurskyense TaxID=320787 RepID=A0A0H4PF74_9BACT|nr:hypothetical protein [Cyclobacterium amurskyense]AKP53126.1 hypothetical protein CA2015_3752 [Cyclobacterium amurskyense]